MLSALTKVNHRSFHDFFEAPRAPAPKKRGRIATATLAATASKVLGTAPPVQTSKKDQSPAKTNASSSVKVSIDLATAAGEGSSGAGGQSITGDIKKRKRASAVTTPVKKAAAGITVKETVSGSADPGTDSGLSAFAAPTPKKKKRSGIVLVNTTNSAGGPSTSDQSSTQTSRTPFRGCEQPSSVVRARPVSMSGLWPIIYFFE